MGANLIAEPVFTRLQISKTAHLHTPYHWNFVVQPSLKGLAYTINGSTILLSSHSTVACGLRLAHPNEFFYDAQATISLASFFIREDSYSTSLVQGSKKKTTLCTVLHTAITTPMPTEL